MPENDDDGKVRLETGLNSGFILFFGRGREEANKWMKIATFALVHINVVSLLSDSVLPCLLHPECWLFRAVYCFVLRIILSRVQSTACLQTTSNTHLDLACPNRVSMRNQIEWITKCWKWNFKIVSCFVNVKALTKMQLQFRLIVLMYAVH